MLIIFTPVHNSYATLLIFFYRLNAFTILLWVYPNQWDVAHTYASNFQYIGGGNSKGWTLNQYTAGAGAVRFRLADTDLANSTDISNAWHHVAGTYDGTTAKLYIDGAFSGQATVTLNTGSTSP